MATIPKLLSAIKVLADGDGLDPFGESKALIHGLSVFDIYSNSWGPYDDGIIFDGPDDMSINSLRTAATEGRDGKGAIITWAAGNGGKFDDCNADGFANSIYTIAVTSVLKYLSPAPYCEQCSSVMVATYSRVVSKRHLYKIYDGKWALDSGLICCIHSD